MDGPGPLSKVTLARQIPGNLKNFPKATQRSRFFKKEINGKGIPREYSQKKSSKGFKAQGMTPFGGKFGPNPWFWFGNPEWNQAFRGQVFW